MGKFYGAIGYGVTEETKPGVWKNSITERIVYGQSIRIASRLNSSEKVNDDISLSVQISFLADPYAMANFSLIKYAKDDKYPGVAWKVKTVDVAYPRLILTLGGVYNE